MVPGLVLGDGEGERKERKEREEREEGRKEGRQVERKRAILGAKHYTSEHKNSFWKVHCHDFRRPLFLG